MRLVEFVKREGRKRVAVNPHWLLTAYPDEKNVDSTGLLFAVNDHNGKPVTFFVEGKFEDVLSKLNG